MYNQNNNCKDNMKYFSATVESQNFDNLFTADKALCHGTIFKDLYIPFECYKNNAIMNPFK